MEGYELNRKIAEGRFGIVFEATRVSTSQRVAVKKVRARRPMPGLGWDPWSRSAERELEVLTFVQHEHVVSLIDHAVSPGSTLLVFEYLAWDLQALLVQASPLDESIVKNILRMILLGVQHLHHCNVMHRDLKPANLLLEGGTGLLKIADFGSARLAPRPADDAGRAAGGAACVTACGATFADDHGALAGAAADGSTPCAGADSQDTLTREVSTRWYKSPEMLFGSVDYTFSVDLWSAGCVFADVLSLEGKPLFPGNNDLEQLCYIFRVAGTPREDEWPEVRRLPDYGKVEFAPREPSPVAFDGHRSPQALELLQQFLRLNPAWRVSAQDALAAEFFHVEPLAAEAGTLIRGLAEERGHSLGDGFDDAEHCSLGSFHDQDWGSEDSGLGPPGAEFEPVEIDTTACGLWDDTALCAAKSPQHQEAPAAAPLAAPLAAEPPAGAPTAADGSAPGARRRTPSPPRGGVHQLKVRR